MLQTYETKPSTNGSREPLTTKFSSNWQAMQERSCQLTSVAIHYSTILLFSYSSNDYHFVIGILIRENQINKN